MALAAAFSVLAFVLSVSIIGTTAAYVDSANAAVRAARTEEQGIGYVRGVLSVLRALQEYRIAVARAGLQNGEAIRTALAAIDSYQAENTALDAHIRTRYRTLRTLALALLAPIGQHRTPTDVTQVINAVEPLLTAISDDSMITYDPVIEGLNLGDADTARFPLALEFALRAALLARAPTAGDDPTLRERFEAARSLAKAQSLIAAGNADVDDALQVNPDLAASLRSRVKRNAAAFANLDDGITAQYVERRNRTDRNVWAILDGQALR